MARLTGIDVGTSALKAIAMDESGAVLARAEQPYGISAPEPGWAEQDPEDWWSACQGALAELGPPTPDAIGLTGQMHGSVFLDEKGCVIRPALLWCDQRTVDECREIEEVFGVDELRALTANGVTTGLQLPKLLWLRNNELSAYQRLHHLLLPKDFVRFRLTGELATDPSDASGTGFFNVSRKEWSLEILSALELDGAWLPPVLPSGQVAGHAQDTPVVVGAGDQAAAAVGAGCLHVGDISLCLGTSGVAFTPVQDSGPREGSVQIYCDANGGWHAMGVTLNCGGALRWARDTFFPHLSFDEMSNLAAESPPGSRGATFCPYLQGERCPHDDPAARGALAGLSSSHTHGELARAVFEGVTFAVADCAAAALGGAPMPSKVRLTGGGAASDFWTQMLADVLNATCERLATDDGPAYGAALLAGVGVGVWPDLETACAATLQVRSVTPPSGEDYSSVIRCYRNLYPALRSWSAAIV